MSFNIGEVRPSVPHLFADLLELCILMNEYEEISYSDAENIIISGNTKKDEDEEEMPSQHTSGSDDAATNDSRLRKIEDTFVHLKYRAQVFGTGYPFEIDQKILKAKIGNANNYKLYKLLLICSRLRSFPNEGGLRQLFANVFEKVSADALRKMMPDNAVVKIFGANSEDRRSYFGTNLQDAWKKLATDISEEIIESTLREESTSGDGGLDLIGYVPFDDNAHGTFAIFGQCASQEDGWPEKVFESHPRNLSSLFTFQHDPVNMMFIPVCYRKSTGLWIKKRSSTGAVLIDRQRICKLLDASTYHNRSIDDALSRLL